MNFIEFLNTDIREFFKRKIKAEEPKEKTTLELLEDITRLIGPKPRLQNIDGLKVWEFRDRVDVLAETGRSRAFMMNHSLPFVKDIQFGENATYFTLRNRKLYDSFYRKTQLQVYAEQHLLPFYETLVDCESHITKTLNDYNYAMLTSYNMLKASIEENGGQPTDKVVLLFKEIIDKFTLSIEERVKRVKRHEDAIKKAVNLSHETQLKLELEHIDKFIRGDGKSV